MIQIHAKIKKICIQRNDEITYLFTFLFLFHRSRIYEKKSDKNLFAKISDSTSIKDTEHART